ncbi:MAG: polyprenyl diphosphate synthase [Brevinematia bacterium]
MEFEELLKGIDRNKLPNHVGIIMDGNGRWAKLRGLPRIEGHKEGLKALESILEFNRYLRIPYITVYAFSKENWLRDKEEVEFLMSMAIRVINDKLKEFKEKGVKFLHIGDKSEIPDKLSNMINELENETKEGNLYTLCVAFNYGGRDEIVQAVKKILEDFVNNKISQENINTNTIGNYIYHPEVPDLDLIIRTSGEKRISNFMLWRSAYAELYFTNTLWPDFKPLHFVEAIKDYQLRERRFGKITKG